MAEVLITDVFDERLKLATEMGATKAINVKDIDLHQAVADFTNNDGAHVVVDAVCSPTSILDALDIVAPSGRFVVLYRGNTISNSSSSIYEKRN
ncbi:zinc-binding dehydrogenase [Gallibacterium anatis]|uniref:Zinc-binding dehydrogenase n=1 Tax=Gallibacterium anatis TaxID=750 RepID=A0A930UWG6_9PAST|nr:zinc-binding dehydrogenase [Gallibacterium anatis]